MHPCNAFMVVEVGHGGQWSLIAVSTVLCDGTLSLSANECVLTYVNICGSFQLRVNAMHISSA